MAEWLYEDGIGERRAALVRDGVIIAAEIERDDDGLGVGEVLAAQLVNHDRLRRRALIRADGGHELWLANPPPALTEGAVLFARVTRLALREVGRDKLAQAVIADTLLPSPPPTMRQRIAANGHTVQDVRTTEPIDALEAAGWSELLDSARTGVWPFPGGALAIALTPAMTLIDIDGDLSPRALAEAGAIASGAAIAAFGLTGSIGIDFPTLSGRADRQAVDSLIDAAVPGPFERTAMNGFGFVQIIRRRERPSLCERMQLDRDLSDALLLLRAAERAVGAGVLTLHTRPPVAALLTARPTWMAALERRTGRAAAIHPDASISGTGHAQ